MPGTGLPRLARRTRGRTPAGSLHVVFTLPAEVAAITFQNKAVVYAILFRTAAETLRTIAADSKHLGAEIGLIAVLHSWGQNLHYHPHIHCIVPGGGVSPDGSRWVSCRPGFFLPVRVLSRLFRQPHRRHHSLSDGTRHQDAAPRRSVLCRHCIPTALDHSGEDYPGHSSGLQSP